MKDMLEREITEGDEVVYGKSDRFQPVNVGTVVNISTNGDESELVVLGRGNTKPGILSEWAVKRRVVVLPKGWLNEL